MLNYDLLGNSFASGGQAKIAHKLCEKFNNEYNIHYVTGNFPKKDSATYVSGVTYHHIGIGSLGPTISLLSYWSLLPLFVMYLSIFKQFTFIIEFFTAPFSVSLVPLVVKQPVIGCPSFLNAYDLYRKYGIPFHWVENFCMKYYRYFIVTTNELKQKVLTYNSNASVKIIPRGVEDDLLDQVPYEKNYLLYLGRIDLYQKGLDHLILVFKKLKDYYKDIKLVIAGGGNEKEMTAIWELLQRLQIDDQVDCIGYVSGVKKNKVIQEAMIVVCPSRFETFGNVALEAMAGAKPLVCSDINGYKWIPYDIAIKVPSEDIDRYVSTISNLLDNKSLRLSLGTKARAFAQSYRWDVIMEKYKNIFESIV